MKKLLIGTLLLLTACGSSTPNPINVTGTWTGTIMIGGDSVGTYTLNLMQATGSDDITGTAINSASATATVTGNLSTGALNLRIPNVLPTVLIGPFTNTTYEGTVTTPANVSGTFSFTKNQ